MGDSIWVAVYLVLLAIGVYAIVHRVETWRIPGIRKATADFLEGPIEEGKTVLIWNKGTYLYPLGMFAFVAVAFVILSVILQANRVGVDWMAYWISSGLFSFLVALLYYYGPIYRLSLRRVIALETGGFRVLFISKETIARSVVIEWRDITEVDLNVGTGGGASTSGSDNGMIIVAPQLTIPIHPSLVNSHLFFKQVENNAPSNLLSNWILEYLRFHGQAAPQVFLNPRTSY